MLQKRLLFPHGFVLTLAFCFSINLFSEEMKMDHSHMKGHVMHKASHHSPSGIMGGESHKKGQFMFSVKQMRMSMKKNSNLGTRLSDQEIISLPNPYYNGSTLPKLSVVPKSMDMEMTMLEGMYGLSDKYTLMFMATYLSKNMKLSSYGAMADRPFLGTFSTQTTDLSSVALSSLIKIKETEAYKLHVEVGLEKSIGSKDIEGEILNPMNMKMNVRFPYSMQAGDKSTSLISAMTFIKRDEDWTYGSQIKNKQAINKKAWNFGDSLALNIWIRNDLSDQLSLSLRGSFLYQDSLEGRDIKIMAPVQTSNPKNYGGKTYEVALGVNRLLKIGSGNSIGLELVIPIKQNLNGPQMELSDSINLVFRKSFSSKS